MILAFWMYFTNISLECCSRSNTVQLRSGVEALARFFRLKALLRLLI